MRSSVTAVLVASRGGEWLDATIAGIASQTRRPDSIIAVNNGGVERVGQQLVEADYGASPTVSRVIGVQSRVAFGRAVDAALSATPAGSNPQQEWVWLLSEDACPEPEALAHILARVEKAQSVAVAGPKLVDWDRPERIIELGQSLTTSGSRWLLRRQELDQQQYDHLEDVLGVGPVGMLIRRDVWDELGGFDPAYPSYDDGLDFCVRTRLAGYRVEVAPESRVRFARSGVAGPRIDRSRKVLRTAHRQARTAHLHRRIAYAPAASAFFLWLGLPLLAVIRVFWALIREQPGNMFGEFVAALAVFFKPGALIASRGRVRRASRVGWAAIRPLRIDQKSVRTARMIDREIILASQGRTRHEMHFMSTGGLAVLLVTVVVGVVLTWWALPQTSLIGGGVAPLSEIGELWRNTRALDGVPADPFAWVLAVLGSLTFWNPSHAIVLVIVLAVPLAALGAWIWAAQISESAAARAVTALGFALSPVLLGSLAVGRIAPLILAVVMPWLLLAATRCRESWSWAGTASLLAAVALACAPVLIPIALIFLVVGIASRLRGALRVLSVAIAPAVLFTPKIIASMFSGRPFDLLMDPGVVLPFTPGSTWHLLLGFPEFGLEGWARILDNIGLGGPPATLLVGVLVLPIALLALLGLYTGRIAITILHALFGGLGLATAVASSRLLLNSTGSDQVALWTGSGLVLYWLAILGLAAVGADTVRRAAPAIVGLAIVAALVAVAPLSVKLVTGDVVMRAGDTQVPAIVQVAGEQDPNTRTLVITATGERSLHAIVVTGTGVRLDGLRTAAVTHEPSAAERRTAELVGMLASAGGSDVGEALAAELDAEGIDFVLLRPGNDPVEETTLQRTLDQHASLADVGLTAQGLLWRVQLPADSADTASDAVVGDGVIGDEVVGDEVVGDDTAPLMGTSFAGHTVWIAQLVVLFSMLLLALPTGEVVERPERRKKPGRVRRVKASKTAVAVTAAVTAAEAVAETAVAEERIPDTTPEVDRVSVGDDPEDPTSEGSAPEGSASSVPMPSAPVTEDPVSEHPSPEEAIAENPAQGAPSGGSPEGEPAADANGDSLTEAEGGEK